MVFYVTSDPNLAPESAGEGYAIIYGALNKARSILSHSSKKFVFVHKNGVYWGSVHKRSYKFGKLYVWQPVHGATMVVLADGTLSPM